MTTLTQDEIQHFIENGYVVLKGCIDRSLAEQWTDHAFERLGYDKHDPTTWEKDIVWLDHANKAPVKDIAPRAWGAICDIVGGEDRIDPTLRRIPSTHFTDIEPLTWSDSFVANFHKGADQDWYPPSPNHAGWHKDGSFFKHFLDSWEQALLVIVLWSDVAHKGGGTYIAPDSIKHVAKFLADHPEGVPGKECGKLIDQCQEFMEVTGETGDVVVMHPFMLHSSSPNHAGKARFITNPPVILKEPMNLNRENPDDFSPLERCTLHALGVERLDFQPTAPREDKFY